MMRFVILIPLVVSSLFFIVTAQAQNQQGESITLPCLEVKRACENAGYSKGMAKSAKTVRDCMARLSSGEKLNDVKISQEFVEACKEKREIRKDKKQ